MPSTRTILRALAVASLLLPAAAGAQERRCNLRLAEPLYRKFNEARVSDSTSALMLAREYLRVCNDSAVSMTREAQSYVDAIDRRANRADRLARRSRLSDLIHIHKNFADAYTLGRELIAEDSTDLVTLITLGYGGFVALESQDRAHDSIAIASAKRALALMDSGATRPSWAPFASAGETRGWLHFTVGSLSYDADPLEAARHFYRATTVESSLRTAPTLYYALAAAYAKAVYQPLYDAYTANFGGKPVTDDTRRAKAQIDTVLDRIVEIYAHGLAHETAGTPEYAAGRERAESYYKARHGAKATGFDAVLERAKTSPLTPIRD